jgi:hypothetical protein
MVHASSEQPRVRAVKLRTQLTAGSLGAILSAAKPPVLPGQQRQQDRRWASSRQGAGNDGTAVAGSGAGRGRRSMQARSEGGSGRELRKAPGPWCWSR